MALETESDAPDQSPIFSKYPAFLKDHHALAFVCDSIRLASSGGVEPFDADQMIESDMEVHHHDATQPIASLSTMADSLPGLGIVAAVLGVVITMGALGGPPEEIGHKVAAALVGTFLGILLCYGFVGPLSQNLAKTADEEHAYYQVLRVMIIAFMKGVAPISTVEMARCSIPGHVRPTFGVTEKFVREKAEAPAAEAAASGAAEKIMATAKPPTIVIKKKGGHGGHHGGAWKVAYADFVTAMMALFIVLWLMNSSKQIQAGWRRDWGSSRIKFTSKGTRIRSPTRKTAITRTGSFRWTARTPREKSSSSTGCAPTR
jgi:flagellar motor component MotA